MKRYKEKFKLKESSWSRIIQHIENNKPFAVISAYQYPNRYFALSKENRDKIKKENIRRTTELRDDVRAMGLGYIGQIGGYTCRDKEGLSGIVEEASLFIPDILYNDAIMLGKKNNQESILFKSFEKGFVLVFTKNFIDNEGNKHNVGEISMSFKYKENKDGKITFNPEVLKYAYSQLKKGSGSQKKQKFAYVSECFEIKEIRYPSKTMCMKRQNETWYKKIA